MMMANVKRYRKGLALLAERVQALLDDGYHILFQFKDKNLALVTLKHHNGNRITLSFTTNDYTITQKTNHIITHRETVRES